jgi:hypothetical protein
MRGRIVRASVLVVAGATLAACSAGSVVMLAGAPEGTPEAPKLSGVYKATVVAPMLGPVEARLTAEPTGNGFKANTRPGVAWSMIGGVEGVLGQVFAPFLFPGGVILSWESAAPGMGKVAEGWIKAGKIKNARMQTRMTSADGPIELLSKEGHRIGTIILVPARADDPPFADYPAVADGVAQALATRLYDPSLARTSQVRGYVRQLRKAAGVAGDDVEFIFGNGAAAYRNLKFSWPIVAKKEVPSLHPAGVDPLEMGTMELRTDEKTGIATIEVKAFLNAEEVDKVFRQVIALDPVALKIDLLKCPGVTLSSLRLASFLVTEPTLVGAFYNSQHRDMARSGKVENFPTVHIDSAESVRHAETALDLHGAVNIVVHPAATRYEGPVAVLTTEKTVTSAEPLVWVLKNHSHARVHGQNTAGKPQISRPVDVGQGWVVWVASADYRPPTGERVDRGIEPHFPARSRDRAKDDATKRLLAEAAKRPPRTAKQITQQPR